MNKPRCNDLPCPYWDGDVLNGLCKRFPREEKKESRDFCGEHPDFGEYLESKGVHLNGPSIRLTSNAKAGLDKKICDCDLSTRAHNILHDMGLAYLGELAQVGAGVLRDRRNMGRMTVRELKGLLSEYDLESGMNIEGWIRPKEQP